MPIKERKILIVDDRWSVRHSISLYLRRQGFQVETTSCAEHALLKLNEYQYDVLLTDVRMPQVNGFVLATIVRELHPNIKIIFMSDYSFDEVKNKYRQLIKYPQLTKPFKMKQLFKLINLEETHLTTN